MILHSITMLNDMDKSHKYIKLCTLNRGDIAPKCGRNWFLKLKTIYL